jgi:hypothetical protein
MSRLVGYWMIDKNRKLEAFIIKGTLVRKKQHDILVTKEDGLFSVIDPTIWQFFKNKRTIFLGNFNTIEEVYNFAKKFYGGKWVFSEKLNLIDSKQEQTKCMFLIKENLMQL